MTNEERRNLINAAMRSSHGAGKTVKVDFSNDDVPRYLENLRKFREKSQATTILVK